MSDAESEQSSVPPPANPNAVPASAHQDAGNGAGGASMHPVWQAAAGRAQSAAARKPVGGTTTPLPARFAPISTLALERRVRGEMDGASSVGSNQGDAPARRRKASKQGKKKRKRARDYDDDEDDEDEDEDNENDEDDDDEVGSDVLAGAAFGGTGAPRKRRASVEPSCASSDGEDVCSLASSALQRECEQMSRQSTSGCVGCMQPSKVIMIDDFVNKHCDKMAEQELFKMAGLVYEDKVVGPARAEGVPVPRWDWKTIAVHYQFHRIDVRYRRVMNIRGLGEVQKMLQLSMTRIDENGDQQVDAQTHDRFLKTYKEHSREISLLQDANAAARPRGGR